MDTTATYRDIIKQVILKYAKLRRSHGDIRLDAVFDETHDRYALMQVGWDMLQFTSLDAREEDHKSFS